MHIGRVPSPTCDPAIIVNQPAQLYTDDPAPVGLAFLANALFAAAFAGGMDQFDYGGDR
jgi:hypothetical protein